MRRPELDHVLTTMLESQPEVSDLLFTVDKPLQVESFGELMPVTMDPPVEKLTPFQTEMVALNLMGENQWHIEDLLRRGSCDTAYTLTEKARFRINIFSQRGNYSIVCRKLNTEIPTLEWLKFPEIIRLIPREKTGLVLVTGATGSGKSTTLAAILNEINHTKAVHVITLEDPVEFVHPHKNCIITQREVGIDTDGWEAALKNTLRQAPDVILMGEIRDRETMEHAVAFAETGHLCMATLHANSSNQALDRIINFFPEERRDQLLMDLSLNLKAIVSQRLLPREEGKGRIAAVEILLNTPLVSDMIFKGEVGELKELMKRSRELGMQTFDQALFDLYEQRHVSYEDALRNADSVNDLRLQIKLNSQRARNQDLAAGTEHLTIV
jgi:twitching motility protein PilU